MFRVKLGKLSRRWQSMLLLSLLLFASLIGCEELDSVSLNYADGSGNVYLVAKNPEPYLEYKPVKPLNSSSGTYDGGEPVKRNITESRYGEILAAVQKAYANPDVQINERVMMSGAVTLGSKDKSISFILKPGCAEQQELESLLKASRDGL